MSTKYAEMKNSNIPVFGITNEELIKLASLPVSVKEAHVRIVGNFFEGAYTFELHRRESSNAWDCGWVAKDSSIEIDETALIGKNVVILGHNVKIGKNAAVDGNIVIKDNVTIGDNVELVSEEQMEVLQGTYKMYDEKAELEYLRNLVSRAGFSKVNSCIYKDFLRSSYNLER